MWFRAACLGFLALLGFFSFFLIIFIPFLPFWGFLLFLEEFWLFLEEKRGFWAFWRHFRPFGGSLWDFQGNIVGKWTNEPCSEVDEVVNHFWVLTLSPRYCGPFEVLERIGSVAYILAFSASTRAHNVFHVYLLKKYVHDHNHVINWDVI